MLRLHSALLLIAVAVSASAQMRVRAVPSPRWQRILIPYHGYGQEPAPGLLTEFNVRNDGDHALQFHFGSDFCQIEWCGQPYQMFGMLPVGTTELYLSESYYPHGTVFTLDERATADVRVSLRAQNFYQGGPEGAFKGPEMPIARERDFKRTIHLLGFSSRLETQLRIYSLDSSPVTNVQLFTVDSLGVEHLLQSFVMTLSAPAPYGPFVALPGFAQLDLTPELPRHERMALRIDAPTPVWAFLLQHDPQSHAVTFVREQ